MKKQVYLFQESCRAAVYGIGTYIRQMIECLSDRQDCVLHVVHIGSEVEHFEKKEMPGYYLYNIPTFCIPMQGKKNHYQRNVYYLMRLHGCYMEGEPFVFIFNYSHQLPLVRFFKDRFPDGRFYFVIHYQDWCFGLNGDVMRLKSLIQAERSTLSLSEQGVCDSYCREKELYRFVDTIVCLSEFTFSLLQEIYGVSPDKIWLIPNGLKDEGKFLAIRERNVLKKQYHFSAGEKIILFVGRLDAIKGIEILIQAFHILLCKNNNYRLIVVGDGDFSSCLNSCEADWSKVVFTGRLKKEQLYDFYQMADIGVMPSRHEQCSYVAIEMMMFGLPMVVSTTTSLKEMVQGKMFGHTFDMEENSGKSVEELATLIANVLESSPEKQLKMRTLSRMAYEEKYSEEVMQEKYLCLMF
ncbi:TIGR04157 family glycosyltransferase [uncultured Parabacteroides sp.]|uniref:TIGR04157 family glycosyltransferase n=1 Tax=uncultured Parabacteroides sp. TaxID=512312 RepID=UPI0026259AEB|nr:TIGR04157 family glycosyltransferase [uncultured Parabacteroides sp.]